MHAVTRMAIGVLGLGLASGPASGQPAPRGDLGQGLVSDASPFVLLVEPLAEKIVEELPAGLLYWRVESFPTLAAAKAREGPWSLAAIAWGEVWLVTLGNQGDITQGGRKVAEVGPIPRSPSADRLLLRVNRAGGHPAPRRRSTRTLDRRRSSSSRDSSPSVRRTVCRELRPGTS